MWWGEGPPAPTAHDTNHSLLKPLLTYDFDLSEWTSMMKMVKVPVNFRGEFTLPFLSQ